MQQTLSKVDSRLSESQPLILGIRSVHLGDHRQVEAVAKELEAFLDGQIEYINARLRRRLFSGPTRLALYFRLFSPRWLPRPAFRWLWERLFCGDPLPGCNPVVICSTLIPSELPCAVLGQWAGAVTIHLHHPARVSPKRLSAVVAAQGVPPFESDIVLSQAPTVLDLEAIQREGQRLIHARRFENRRLWTLLIGGTGGGYDWQSGDFAQLAQQVNACFARFGIQWLISTSPRTGNEVERVLQSLIQPEAIADCTWYSENRSDVVAGYMGAAERIFVTEESISMLSDAMLARKPLYSLVPAQLDSASKPWAFAIKLAQSGHLKRVLVDQPISAALLMDDACWFVPNECSWRLEFRQQLLERCPELSRLPGVLANTAKSQEPAVAVHYLRARYENDRSWPQRGLPVVSASSGEASN